MMAALATAAMTLGELLGPAAGDLSGVAVSDLVLDSRQVQPGAAFLALHGSRDHGLDHLDDALARGAVVVIYEPSESRAPGHFPSIAVPELRARLGELARSFFGKGVEPIELAGVTGTNGKSTVAHLMAEAQTLLGTPCAYLGTLGHGVPPDLTAQPLTTPDCLTLHRTLRSLQARYAAMEVSSHALAQNRIAGLDFHTALFTNLSRDHLDYHDDIESYRDAKLRLFGLPGLRDVVLFADDSSSAAFAEAVGPDVARIDVSFEHDAVLRGRVAASSLDGIEIEVSGSFGPGLIASSLLGDFNAENLLVALGGLLAWDVPIARACEALSGCRGLPGRMQLFAHDGAPAVVVDYAHTPAALTRVLESLRAMTEGELWCVFGCGGERDAGKREPMGAAAARLADHIVLTDDNPREEDPGAIVADIRAGTVAHPDVWVEHDRRRAIADAISKARASDLVLVAGKGHEQTQRIAGGERPFLDAAVVEEALGGRA